MDCGRVWLRSVVTAALWLAWGYGWGQTLAHKNWEGSGLKAEAWWSRAEFCVAGGNLNRVLGEMDALERMGCDAVEVTPGGGYGAVEAMDAVTEGAGRRKMRVVVDLGGGEDDVRAQMGFWGARGAAGFAVRGLGEEAVGRLRQAVGGRVVIGDGGGGQLRVRRIPVGDGAAARGFLAGAVRAGVVLEDGEARLGYARAAMVLASGVAGRVGVDAVLPVVEAAGAAREFSAEEMLLWVPKEKVAKDGMVDWVGGLGALRRENAALRAGLAVYLDFDALGVVGWVVSGRDGRGAVLVVCNLSGKAVKVPVAGPMRAGGMKGSLGKTLLRSDGKVGGVVALEGIELGVGGVFVGKFGSSLLLEVAVLWEHALVQDAGDQDAIFGNPVEDYVTSLLHPSQAGSYVLPGTPGCWEVREPLTGVFHFLDVLQGLRGAPSAQGVKADLQQVGFRLLREFDGRHASWLFAESWRLRRTRSKTSGSALPLASPSSIAMRSLVSFASCVWASRSRLRSAARTTSLAFS